MIREAIFSEDRNHRFILTRSWDESRGSIMFIGLNPSKANETEDDQTIKKVIGFVKKWGYGRVYMANLFSFVSTDPEKLNIKESLDVLSINDNYLATYGAPHTSTKVIFAWGNFKIAEDRAAEVMKMFPDAYCLGHNKNGTPKHPSRTAYIWQPVPFALKVEAKSITPNMMHGKKGRFESLSKINIS